MKHGSQKHEVHFSFFYVVHGSQEIEVVVGGVFLLCHCFPSFFHVFAWSEFACVAFVWGVFPLAEAFSLSFMFCVDVCAMRIKSLKLSCRLSKDAVSSHGECVLGLEP